jgi:hypothetical protein
VGCDPWRFGAREFPIWGSGVIVFGLSDYGTLAFEVKSSFAKHIESSVYDDLQELLQTPEQIGLLKFLEQYPLNGLYFTNNILVNAMEVNGVYTFSTQEASINLTRTSKDFGQVYQKQQFWSISTLAINQHSAIQRTFVHELGHPSNFTQVGFVAFSLHHDDPNQRFNQQLWAW